MLQKQKKKFQRYFMGDGHRIFMKIVNRITPTYVIQEYYNNYYYYIKQKYLAAHPLYTMGECIVLFFFFHYRPIQ